jgi:IclR family pca regulon transcriptional regulator
MPMSHVEDREFVQSLAKGLAVIESFGPQVPAMTLSEVARKTKLSPGSARRVLRTLQRLGYMQSDGQRFALAPRTLQLGYAYLASQPMTSLVQPRLSQLVQKLEGSCSVSVLDGTDVVYVARATGKGLTRDYMSVGTRFPAHATSPGKILLAALPIAELKRRLSGHKLETLTSHTISVPEKLYAALDEARRKGWAVNDQETSLGHRSVAVPISIDDRVVAALGIGCIAARVTLKVMVEDYLPKLKAAAAAISETLAASKQAGETIRPR